MNHIQKYSEFEKIDEGLKDIAIRVLNWMLFPITLPVLANMNTKSKLSVIKKMVENYINEKSEYQILDEAKYDIEMPSELTKVSKRLKELSKKFKKWPTLKSYCENFCKMYKKLNIINFKNGEDIYYLCDEAMKLSDNEDERVTTIKYNLKYDSNKYKVRSKYREEMDGYGWD